MAKQGNLTIIKDKKTGESHIGTPEKDEGGYYKTKKTVSSYGGGGRGMFTPNYRTEKIYYDPADINTVDMGDYDSSFYGIRGTSSRTYDAFGQAFSALSKSGYDFSSSSAAADLQKKSEEISKQKLGGWGYNLIGADEYAGWQEAYKQGVKKYGRPTSADAQAAMTEGKRIVGDYMTNLGQTAIEDTMPTISREQGQADIQKHLKEAQIDPNKPVPGLDGYNPNAAEKAASAGQQIKQNPNAPEGWGNDPVTGKMVKIADYNAAQSKDSGWYDEVTGESTPVGVGTPRPKTGTGAPAESTGTPAGQWIRNPAELSTLTKDDIAKLSNGKVFRRDLALEKQKIDEYRSLYGAPEADWQKFHDFAYAGIKPTTAGAPEAAVSSDIQKGLQAAQDRIAKGKGTPEDKKNVEYAKSKGLIPGGEETLDPKQEIANIDEEANKLMEEEFEKIEDSGVDVSKSSELTKKLLEMFEGEGDTKKPKAPSLEEQFEAKRVELGIDVLETELAGVESDIELINTTLLVEAEKAGEKLVSMAQIGRRRGKLQMEAEQRIALLNIEKNAISRQLNNKLNTLNTVMSLTQQDFANASTLYNNEFNKNLQMINLISGIESQEKADAQANLNTIINLAQNANKGFDDLSPSIQRHINNLEIQQGLPPGVTSSFLTAKPNTKILSTTSGTDAAGNSIVTFIYEDPETGRPGTIEIVETGGVKKATGTGGGGGGDTDTEGGDWDRMEQFIKDNPNASNEELKTELLKNVNSGEIDLSVTEINARLAQRKVEQKKEKEEEEEQEEKNPISEAMIDNIAGQFVKAVKGFLTHKNKEFEKALLLIENNKVKKKWSQAQVDAITQKVKEKLKIK
ncbi:hypothetical protein KAJ89_04030 [Candidatus Parcubacteria bacterium]|nr:hypothetical protein [Candidatus Parcubacteria bacterium]